MKVLLSIKPEYANQILEGKKLFEFRKSVFKKIGVKTIVIYATMPIGKIIGEFEVSEIMSGHPSEVWEATAKYSGITLPFFNNYFNGRKTAHAIKVKNPVRYETPIELTNVLKSGVAPQSFCYLS